MLVNLFGMDINYYDPDAEKMVTIKKSKDEIPHLEVLNNGTLDEIVVFDEPEFKEDKNVVYIVTKNVALALNLRTDLVFPYDMKIKNDKGTLVCECKRLVTLSEYLSCHRCDMR